MSVVCICVHVCTLPYAKDWICFSHVGDSIQTDKLTDQIERETERERERQRARERRRERDGSESKTKGNTHKWRSHV